MRVEINSGCRRGKAKAQVTFAHPEVPPVMLFTASPMLPTATPRDCATLFDMLMSTLSRNIVKNLLLSGNNHLIQLLFRLELLISLSSTEIKVSEETHNQINGGKHAGKYERIYGSSGNYLVFRISRRVLQPQMG